MKSIIFADKLKIVKSNLIHNTSDRKLKTKIANIENALAKVRTLTD